MNGVGGYQCSVCAGRELERLGSAELGGVTSDCKPWPDAGEIAVCTGCGHVQKLASKAWRQVCAAIYADYDLYHQSGGVEQVLFGPDAAARTRSSLVLTALARRLRLPEVGHLLDVGCGNGATLKAAHDVLPQWGLTGAEQNDRLRERVLSLPGVEAFCSGPLESLRTTFDVISVVHVLEHVSQPVAFLSQLRRMLRPEGAVLIQVPDLPGNPFDLLIADHCSHFTAATLVALVEMAGFQVEAIGDAVIPKELTLIGRPALKGKALPTRRESGLELGSRSLDWLRQVLAAARGYSSQPPFGLFGTAIAGTWLGGVLGDRVDFFVDEDRLRQGRYHLGRPILMPDEVPDGHSVYMALPVEIAGPVYNRLQLARPSVHYVLPPPRTMTAAAWVS